MREQHFSGVVLSDAFPVGPLLNPEWIYRGFRMKGKELDQLQQGMRSALKARIYLGFCPGLPYVQM